MFAAFFLWLFLDFYGVLLSILFKLSSLTCCHSMKICVRAGSAHHSVKCEQCATIAMITLWANDPSSYEQFNLICFWRNSFATTFFSEWTYKMCAQSAITWKLDFSRWNICGTFIQWTCEERRTHKEAIWKLLFEFIDV